MEPLPELLFSLRTEQRTIPEVGPELQPEDLAAGYRHQAALVDALCRERGGAPIGYKGALTGIAAQELVGHDAPVFGTMLAASHWTSGVALAADDFTTRVIETEFGFRMADDVRAGSHTRESIAAHVEAVVPSIEIVDHRFAALNAMTAPVLAADNAIHGGWIQGTPVTEWSLAELDRHPVELRVNGTSVLRGAGDRVLGHPLEVLAWLANELPRHGPQLRAGDWVTTGLATDGIYDAAAGDEIVADFGTLGQVTASFT